MFADVPEVGGAGPSIDRSLSAVGGVTSSRDAFMKSHLRGGKRVRGSRRGCAGARRECASYSGKGPMAMRFSGGAAGAMNVAALPVRRP